MGHGTRIQPAMTQAQVKDIRLPNPFNNMIPVVEFSFNSPENRGGGETTGTINPGILYETRYFQIGAEAIIPVNDATGHNVGAVVQLQIFLDDIWPKWFAIRSSAVMNKNLET